MSEEREYIIGVVTPKGSKVHCAPANADGTVHLDAFFCDRMSNRSRRAAAPVPGTLTVIHGKRHYFHNPYAGARYQLQRLLKSETERTGDELCGYCFPLRWHS